MKNFEERYTAWLDGQLDEGERREFEAGLPDREAAMKDAGEWRKLRGDLREVVSPATVPHADFLNSQILEAIRRQEPAAPPPSPAAGGWFPVRRLAWTGAFLAVVAAVLSWWWAPRNGGMPSEGQFISQVVEARSSDPKLGAYAFAAPGGKAAVLWIDAGYIPANEQLK
jgi:anti-sigma factor RsiW